MKYWFRDQFNNTEQMFKIGGYDPYMDEYVLSVSDYRMPFEVDSYPCGSVISQKNTTGYYQFNIEIGDLIGSSVIGIDISEGDLQFIVEYDGEVVDNQNLEGPTVYGATVIKTATQPTFVTVTIVSVNASYMLSGTCATSSESITVRRITLNSSENEGETIHNQYRWSFDGYDSPYLTDFVTMTGSGVSFDESQTGILSSGMIPADGADITMISNKYPSDSFIFDPEVNRFRYLISNTAYTVNELIPVLNDATPITGSYQAVINSAALSGFSYLYLVWDYRFLNEFTLCYNVANPYLVCCDCAPATYYLNSDSFALATTIYTDEDMVTVAPDGYYMLDDVYREMLDGVLLDSVACPGCLIQTQCFEGVWVNPDPEHPDGGSITYVNADGETLTIDGIYVGDLVTLEFLEIISLNGVVEVECPSLVEALRTTTGADVNTGTLCEDLDTATTFYIYGNDGCVIETGNVACNTSDLLDRFDGQFKYYKVYITICDSETYTYICQINATGVITVIGGACPPTGI
jgi:hypothetical protein